jgi:hypothetical protein
MAWLFKLLPKTVINRFILSGVRYAIAGLIALLLAKKEAVPGLETLAELLSINAEALANSLATILGSVLTFWSVEKNISNLKVEQITNRKVK